MNEYDGTAKGWVCPNCQTFVIGGEQHTCTYGKTDKELAFDALSKQIKEAQKHLDKVIEITDRWRGL